MNFLLDTNVVSETRRRVPHRSVIDWLAQVEQDQLYLSVLTLGELTKGVALRRRRDPRGAANLAHWLDGIELLFADRVLPVDAADANVWGEMSANRSRPVIDTLLAATAQVHALTLVTRNVKDVGDLPIPVLDPWDSSQSVT